MPIQTVCTQCQARFNAPEKAVGRQVNCPKCQQAFVIQALVKPTVPATAAKTASSAAQAKATAPRPQTVSASKPAHPSPPIKAGSPPQTTAEKPAPLTEAELAAAFTGAVPRTRVPLSYRFGVLLASGVMVALVAVYLSLIAAVGWLVFYHFTHHGGLLSMPGGGRARALAFIVYAAPGFIGPVVIFFLFKPLLARPAKQERTRSITRQGEPMLFLFVDRVCESVGAPVPKRIDVDCDVNASASFRRGLLSFLGKDLVLTIGLPLLAGLSCREFGGVLAHEFGHFAQGAGMRMSYLVRSLSGWFMRVVYQRDQWDEWLESTSEDLDLRIGWVVLVAQGAVAVSRGVLWVLMRIGMLVSGILLRQMEFDADRYETKFAGAEAFASTSRKLGRLSLASQLASAQINEHLVDRRLVDNLPALISINARAMPPETAAKFDAEADAVSTGWYDTHPCQRDRVAAAQRLGGEGVFRLERPARELLADFAAQAKATTWDLYMGAFGPKVPRDALVPAPEFARASKASWK
jgi:hypothetical protein